MTALLAQADGCFIRRSGQYVLGRKEKIIGPSLIGRAKIPIG